MADIDKLKLMLKFFEDLSGLVIKPLEDDGKVSLTDFLDATFYTELVKILASAKTLYDHHEEIAEEVKDLDPVEVFQLVAAFNDLTKSVYEKTQLALEASKGDTA